MMRYAIVRFRRILRESLADDEELPLCQPNTWPETWTDIPSRCPVCGHGTVPDRHLDSRAGPGWRCSLTSTRHFWQVRMDPMRRYRLRHSPEPCYPWIGYSPAEQQAWMEAHTHLPRVVPSQPAPAPAASRSSSPERLPARAFVPEPCQNCAHLVPGWHDGAHSAERIHPCPSFKSTMPVGLPTTPAANSEPRS